MRTLCRLGKLGIHLTEEKQNAILKGDMSNKVVPRFYIYACGADGMNLCETLDESPPMIRNQAVLAQRGWESLIELQREGNQEAKAQSLLFLAFSCIILGFSSGSSFYLSKACRLINWANLQFIPTYGRAPALSDHVREKLAILSQAIYIENYLFLTWGMSHPELTARIEREFRGDLQVSGQDCDSGNGRTDSRRIF